MKIKLELPVRWGWICAVLIALIAGHCLYHWRDARYEKALAEKAQIVQIANNLAQSLYEVGSIRGMPPNYINAINQILQNNGYKQQIVIPEVKPDSTEAGK